MVKQNTLSEFFKQNAWGLIIAFVTLISFYALTNYRLTKAEEKIEGYPSVDYFNLKFKFIDQQLEDLNLKVTEHINYINYK